MSKAIYLLLTCFVLAGTLPAFSNGYLKMNPPGHTSELNNGLEKLNQSMEEALKLSAKQDKVIRQANRDFWEERQAIIEQTGKIAKHTALLASWDRWARELELILDKYQYKAFLKWQYQVSPLSEQPY